jgi:predicted transport protein
MSTIKLFKTRNDSVIELNTESIGVEKSLQMTIEKHLELFLGVRFLASEYTTGKSHGGRIDTLGMDENGAPVIIEYKRSINENVINQGLFYLDWLLDHKGEFTLMVLRKFGKDTSENIEWSNSRLLCIAGEFTKYDEYAVEQINRNIELIRYRKFEDGILLFELVNASSADQDQSGKTSNHQKYTTVLELLDKMGKHEKDRYETLKAFILALGDDIQEKITKYYIAYKRLSNFACFEFHPNNQEILIFLKINPSSILLEENFSRDVSKIGHYGTGDLELRVKSDGDVKKAQELILRSYDLN